VSIIDVESGGRPVHAPFPKASIATETIPDLLFNFNSLKKMLTVKYLLRLPSFILFPN
jgi:hypothetical protein